MPVTDPQPSYDGSQTFDLTPLLDQLLGQDADPVAAGYRLRELAEQSTGRSKALLTQWADRREDLPSSDPAILGGLLRVLHTVALQAGAKSVQELSSSAIAAVDASLPPETPNRHLLLHLYAMIRSDRSLGLLLEALRTSPPEQWIAAAQVLTPLMQHDDWAVEALFPAALDCLQYPSLASPLLDLANYLFRKSRVAQHPAADRLPMLNELLGQVTHRLNTFEENPRSFGDDVETVQARLGEAVALAVSLCDTVGLIGDASSIAKLYPAVELRHRRVQCEAAGALARLDDDLGKKRLLELTAEPAARLRAIHYADELGFGDEVDSQYRTDNATAEAEMALWLTQPQQMGVPPTKVEVVDTRRLLWPSFTNPVDVTLVRFEYNLGEQTFSNIGICGPTTFALSTDVANLPNDDIYAMYAGWHAEHPDIFSVEAEKFNEPQKRMMAVLQGHLTHLGYEQPTPKLLGFFLDEHAGVFFAIRDETQCAVITDGLETMDLPITGRIRPPMPEDLFNLYKGRKMLRTFNSGEV